MQGYECSASNCQTNTTKNQIGGSVKERKVKVTHDAHTVDTLEPLRALSHLLRDKLVQTLAPALLHSFKAEPKVNWEIETLYLMRLEHVQPTHDRTLVVRRSTPIHLPVFLDEPKRIRVPSVRL
jgi:hypothetical protein